MMYSFLCNSFVKEYTVLGHETKFIFYYLCEVLVRISRNFFTRLKGILQVDDLTL